MSYSDIVATIAMIVSITAVPASGYLSFKYAIKGEKRKEFNAIADTLRGKLREQTRLIHLGYYPNEHVTISDAEFEQFIDVCEKSKHKMLIRLWGEYQTALEESGEYDEYNHFKFIAPERLLNAIIKLSPVAERR
ncbi:TPA: hypothetical protein ACF3P8_002624 [Serratia marcescens]|jgi:hypothetical protein